MLAVSRNECFSAQGNLERVQVFGELSAIDRMELIDASIKEMRSLADAWKMERNKISI